MSEPRPSYGNATLDDLMRISHGEATHELSDGQLLVAEPPPGWQHGAVAINIGSAIHAFARQHNLGKVVICDTWFVLRRHPDTVRGPDVAFVRRARCARLAHPEAPFAGPPDLAVEVISPSDTRSRIARKVHDYQRAGTLVIWLADATAKTITVIDHTGERRLGDGETLTCPELLPGFEFSIGEAFE